MRLLLALLMVLGWAVACAPVPTPSAPVPATVEPATPSSSATAPGMGAVIVRQARIGGGVYIEGAYAYVEVTDANGTLLQRIEDPEYHLAKEIARLELPAGRYVIGTYVRPCEAACPVLGGPADGCDLTVDVVAGETVGVLVERWAGRACEAAIVDS